MKQLWNLFWAFFKVGTFTLGGGYAMIPLMEEEVVNHHHWADEENFSDMVVLSQSMPGAFAINMATIVGYRIKGVAGVAVSILGNILAPISIILFIAIALTKLPSSPTVERVFMGLRPAVVALMVAPLIRMSRTAGLSWKNCWIPITVLVLVGFVQFSSIWVIVVAIVLTIIATRFKLL